MPKRLGVAICSLMLAGCSGELITAQVPGDSIETIDPHGIRGAIYYPPILVREVYETTHAVDKNGVVVAVAAEERRPGDNLDECIPIRTTEITRRPDLDKPMIIRYDPGLLENNKFSVTLQDSMISSVNTESQPDRGQTFANIAGAVKTLAETGSVLGVTPPEDRAGRIRCNIGKKLRDVSRQKVRRL